MKDKSLWWVKALGAFFLVIIVVFGVRNSRKKDQAYDAYRPMIKVDDQIYLWEEDLADADPANLEKLGEIKFSYEDGSKALGPEDENFSSNVCPVGAEIYRYDDSSILEVSDGKISSFKKDKDKEK